MRDNLSINPEEFAAINETPRDQRLRASSAKRALKAGFMSLPKPENNFELLVPEDEEDDAQNINGPDISEEDAAERDARLKRLREAEEKAALARRSQAVKLGLPRPANVDVEDLLRQLNIDESGEPGLARAHRLINAELVRILRHDSIAHPLPGTSIPGGTISDYDMPSDGDIDTAKSAIDLELASAVGFPNANPDQLRDGLLSISKAEAVDDSNSWAAVRQDLGYDASSKSWVDPGSLSLQQRIEGYTAILNDCRELMTKDASKATKAEKKLGVTLGGYQARSQALSKRITEAFEELRKIKVDFDSFSRLRVNELAVGPRRVAALKEEVEKLERREKLLQERYAELEAERRESQSRVAILEEKVMAEAEALNEASLAEMDGTET
jgi:pre-mRNA-splicing factor CDC5/CEF1